MSSPFVGEIRIFGGNFAPNGWMFCQGQLLPISEFDTLFSLLGTTYGGDGQETFALPDLQGRLPVHQGNGFTIAQTGGAESVTLTIPQIPAHSHPLTASTALGDNPNPAGQAPAESSVVSLYQAGTPATPMAPQSVTPAGGSQPHDNMHPYLCLNFILSLFGIYPSPT